MLGDPATAAEVWFVLHGYGQLAGRFVRRFQGLPGLPGAEPGPDAPTRAVVAPEALSRFYVDSRPGGHGPESRVGATWMTREARQDDIHDYIAYLDAVASAVLPPARHPRIVVLGFSQGAETAARWATYGATRTAELILWGGGLAADLDMPRASVVLRDTALRFVVGDDDAWARQRAGESEARLAEVGLAAERLDYPGGHRITPFVLARHWSGSSGSSGSVP